MVATRTDKRIKRIVANGTKWCEAADCQAAAIESSVEAALRSGKPNSSRVAAVRLQNLATRYGYEGMSALINGDRDSAWTLFASSRDLWWPDFRLSGGTAGAIAPVMAHYWESGDLTKARYLASKLAEGRVRRPAFGVVTWGIEKFPSFMLWCWSRINAEPRVEQGNETDLGVYAPFCGRLDSDLRGELNAMLDYHLHSVLSDESDDFCGPPYQLLLVELMALRRVATAAGTRLPAIAHPLVDAGFDAEIDWSSIRISPHRLVEAIAEKARKEGNLPTGETL